MPIDQPDGLSYWCETCKCNITIENSGEHPHGLGGHVISTLLRPIRQQEASNYANVGAQQLSITDNQSCVWASFALPSNNTGQFVPRKTSLPVKEYIVIMGRGGPVVKSIGDNPRCNNKNGRRLGKMWHYVTFALRGG